MIAFQVAQECSGRRDRVAIDDERGRSFARGGDHARSNPAQHGHANSQRRHQPDRVLASRRSHAAANGAKQDGCKRGAFDQRIAGRQFVGFQVDRQDAVFNRPKQRADNAVAGQCHEQDRHRVHNEPQAGQHGDRDFGALQFFGDYGLVEAVGKLPAERR